MRDTNDLSRRPPLPPKDPKAAKAVESAHRESTPENPQGGQWVKFRLDAGGMPVTAGHALSMLKTMTGYEPGKGSVPDGD